LVRRRIGVKYDSHPIRRGLADVSKKQSNPS